MKPPLAICERLRTRRRRRASALDVHPRVVREHELQLAAALEDVLAERPPQRATAVR